MDDLSAGAATLSHDARRLYFLLGRYRGGEAEAREALTAIGVTLRVVADVIDELALRDGRDVTAISDGIRAAGRRLE